MVIANKMESGIIAAILAYGFSGNNPYHFSNRYLRPWATKIAIGKIKKMMAFGLKPVIIIVKTKSNEAIELREAKKPFVVEKRPIKANARVGILNSGVKNTLSSEPLHKNTGANPLPIFPKK